jgi:predicted RNase H-like HicB family nuclease
MAKKLTKKILEFNVVFEEAEEGGYTAYVPSLPGCFSEGDTLDEAKKNIVEAIEVYLESLAKDKEEITQDSKSILIGTVKVNFSKFASYK